MVRHARCSSPLAPHLGMLPYKTNVKYNTLQAAQKIKMLLTKNVCNIFCVTFLVGSRTPPSTSPRGAPEAPRNMPQSTTHRRMAQQQPLSPKHRKPKTERDEAFFCTLQKRILLHKNIQSKHYYFVVNDVVCFCLCVCIAQSQPAQNLSKKSSASQMTVSPRHKRPDAHSSSSSGKLPPQTPKRGVQTPKSGSHPHRGVVSPHHSGEGITFIFYTTHTTQTL